jgi:hypothetical protein
MVEFCKLKIKLFKRFIAALKISIKDEMQR